MKIDKSGFIHTTFNNNVFVLGAKPGIIWWPGILPW
jgi:hypothetical protein